MATSKDRNRLMLRKLTELSLVDNPANPHARAVIYKRATGMKLIRKNFDQLFKRFLDSVTPHVQKEAQSYAQTRAIDQLWSKTNALSTSISTIISGDDTQDEKAKQLDATLSQFRDDIQALNTDDSAFQGLSDEEVGKESPAAPVADITPPAVAANDHPVSQEPTMKRVAKSFTDLAAAQAHIGELTTELCTLDERVDKLEAAADPIAAITKGMSTEAATAYRAQAERVAKLEQNAEVSKRIAKAVVIVGKAGDGEDHQMVATILKSIDGNADALAYIEKLFSQYNGMVDLIDGLELGGDSADGAPDANTALQKAAEEVQKINPKMSHAEAVKRALEINPALYDDTELSAVK
jgi:hypothetical protein